MKAVMLEPIGALPEDISLFKEKLLEAGCVLEVFSDKPTSEDEILERINGAEVVVLSQISMKEPVLSRCPSLKMLSVAFTGLDHIDTAFCEKKGITVCNAAGYSTDSVAELTFGLIFSVLRKIVWGDEKVRGCQDRAGFLGTELKGKTLGVIGTGAIGCRVAELGRAFGCNVIAYSKSEKEGIDYVALEELLKRSDIVSIHVPLTADTKKMIGRRELSLMKKSAILINTARGGVVDNVALTEVLCSGELSGAGVDVFDVEPPLPKDYPLLSVPNAVLVPHVGYATKEAIAKRTKIVFENVLRFVNRD